LTIGNGNGLTHHSVPLLNINKETKKNKQRLNKQKKSIKRLFLLLLLEFININNFKTITSYNDDFNFKIKKTLGFENTICKTHDINCLMKHKKASKMAFNPP